MSTSKSMNEALLMHLLTRHQSTCVWLHHHINPHDNWPHHQYYPYFNEKSETWGGPSRQGYYPARCPTLIPLEITTTAIDRSHYHNSHKQFFWKPIKTGLIGPVLSEKLNRIAHWTDQSLPRSFRKPGSTRETHELDLAHRALQLCRRGQCDSL